MMMKKSNVQKKQRIQSELAYTKSLITAQYVYVPEALLIVLNAVAKKREAILCCLPREMSNDLTTALETRSLSNLQPSTSQISRPSQVNCLGGESRAFHRTKTLYGVYARIMLSVYG
jgi:hypothetical protein